MAFVQDELNKQFVKLYNSGNMNGLSELFTEDCKMMAPGSDTVKGRADVASVFNETYVAGAKKLKVDVLERGPLGSKDIEFESCQSTLFKEDGSIFDQGKFVVIKKKQAGKWLYYLDIFNSSQNK